MAIFNCYVSSPEGRCVETIPCLELGKRPGSLLAPSNRKPSSLSERNRLYMVVCRFIHHPCCSVMLGLLCRICSFHHNWGWTDNYTWFMTNYQAKSVPWIWWQAKKMYINKWQPIMWLGNSWSFLGSPFCREYGCSLLLSSPLKIHHWIATQFTSIWAKCIHSQDSKLPSGLISCQKTATGDRSEVTYSFCGFPISSFPQIPQLGP